MIGRGALTSLHLEYDFGAGRRPFMVMADVLTTDLWMKNASDELAGSRTFSSSRLLGLSVSRTCHLGCAGATVRYRF